MVVTSQLLFEVGLWVGELLLLTLCSNTVDEAASREDEFKCLQLGEGSESTSPLWK